MKITFDFNDQQTAAFKEFLMVSWSSFQQEQLILGQEYKRIADEGGITIPNHELKNMQNYIQKIVEQQEVVEEILTTIHEAEKDRDKPRIII